MGIGSGFVLSVAILAAFATCGPLLVDRAVFVRKVTEVCLGSVGSVALCASGIFVGGAVWSLIYTRYRSVWPCYVSHAIVDICVCGIGAWMVFGR